MLELLSSRWWVFAVRGALSVIFGLLAIFWPAITLLVLAILVGAYLVVDGAFSIYHSLAHTTDSRSRWLLIFQGALSLILGVLIFIWPATGVLALVIMFGFWALAGGVVQIVAAVQLRKEISGEWYLVVMGVLSVLAGLAMIILPMAGAYALALLIGCFAIVLGIVQIMLGLRLRRAGREGVLAG